ncbi:hypothetical protein MRB53_015481 [Persea americana]|uniref:Uncharacterized protein n=1 Tax=Persea americana TaxID=3435 RepID=A0ACC2LZ72_PERAE|nr:hypothetical protein MRB53_015481 [Persea americana]
MRGATEMIADKSDDDSAIKRQEHQHLSSRQNGILLLFLGGSQNLDGANKLLCYNNPMWPVVFKIRKSACA